MKEVVTRAHKFCREYMYTALFYFYFYHATMVLNGGWDGDVAPTTHGQKYMRLFGYMKGCDYPLSLGVSSLPRKSFEKTRGSAFLFILLAIWSCPTVPYGRLH